MGRPQCGQETGIVIVDMCRPQRGEYDTGEPESYVDGTGTQGNSVACEHLHQVDVALA